MIPRHIVDQVLETAQIEEVISDFVTLKKAGSNLKGLSPFADEKTPSFMVSPAKQIFKDFSSGKGGNVATFLMEHEQLSFPEAIKWLAEKYGIEIEEEFDEEQKEEATQRESLLIILKFANDYFGKQLFNTDEGRSIGLSYFRERGFSEETIKTFGLGYNPEGWDKFTTEALGSGYKKEFLEQLGLIKTKDQRSYDVYRGRVIFPIHNLSGKVIGFGARTLKSDKNIPKYINSPESPVYDKSNVLYGLSFAKNEIRKKDNCYLVEGYTDVISLYQNGVQNVVSSSGTSLTEGQIRLIKRYTPNVTILYDGDAAGIKASFRGIDMLLSQGLKVRVVLFPDGEDPDSFARQSSTTELLEYLEDKKQDFIGFKTGLLSKEADKDPIKRAELIKDIVDSIALIPEQIDRAVYIQNSSRILKVDEQTLLNELNRVRRNKLKKQVGKEQLPESEPIVPITAKQQEKQETNTDYQEKDILRLLLNYGNNSIKLKIEDPETQQEEEHEFSVATYMLHDLASDDLEFSNPLHQEVLEIIVEEFSEHEEIKLHSLSNHPNAEIQQFVSDLVSNQYELHNWEKSKIYVKTEDQKMNKAVIGALLSFKTRRIEMLMEENQKKLKEVEDDFIQLTKILEEKRSLDKIKADISKQLGRVIIR